MGTVSANSGTVSHLGDRFVPAAPRREPIRRPSGTDSTARNRFVLGVGDRFACLSLPEARRRGRLEAPYRRSQGGPNTLPDASKLVTRQGLEP